MKKLMAALTTLVMVLVLAVPMALAGKPGGGDTTAPVTTASPLGGSYSGSVTVTLSVNESATTYYTTNGSPPTTASAVYSAPLAISATTTLQYFSRDTAGNSEAVKSQTYTITVPPPAGP